MLILNKREIESRTIEILDELLRDIEKDFNDPQKDEEGNRTASIKVIIKMEDQARAMVSIRGTKQLAESVTGFYTEVVNDAQMKLKEDDF